MRQEGAEVARLRECRALTRLISGGLPDAYVSAQYEAAHAEGDRFEPTDRFDALLVRLAAGFTLLRRPVAAYARIFRPKGALQRKLVLVLSILESSSPSYREMDRALRGGSVPMVSVLALRSFWWLGALAVGVVLLGPIHLALRGGRGS